MDIAKAFLIEANNDYDVVSMLVENEKFNLATYHAQQAVEKLLKACLAAQGKIGIYKHEIFSFFLKEFNKRIDDDTMQILEDAVVPLEESWSISRYPDWTSEPIWVPSQRFTFEDGEISESRMNTVFEILVPFLKIRYGIEV